MTSTLTSSFAATPVDLQSKAIEVGQDVAVAFRDGNGCEMRIGTVVEVTPSFVGIDWHRSSNGYLPESATKIGDFKRIVILG